MSKQDYIVSATTTVAPPVERTGINKWKILFFLFLANMLNFFDRTIPSIIIEPLRFEFSLSDLQLGLVTAAFTLVYAVAGLPFGRMADKGSRKNIIG